MNKWGMKGIVLGLCLSMMAPMAVAMVPGMSVEAAPASGTPSAEDELKADIKEKAAELRAYKISLKPNANQTARIDALLQETYKKIGYSGVDKIYRKQLYLKKGKNGLKKVLKFIGLH